MNWNYVAGALCGWIALCLFASHIVSSPRRTHWMTIPEYVRRGFLVAGAMMLWRSVNFISVASSPPMPGQINAEGMMATLAMTYFVTSLAWWVFGSVMTRHAWDRVDWFRREMSEHPEHSAVMLTPHEVAQVARASGAQAVEAGEGAEAVVREVALRGPRQKVASK